MCWSGEASTVIAVIGGGITAYAVYQKQPMALWATLGFFAGMEALQALTYPVIDQCGNERNQLLTKIAYVHIMLQPFFFNALALHFVPEDVRRRVQRGVYACCAASVAFMIWQVMPSETFGACGAHRGLCGTDFCSYSGEWHLAWETPMNGFGNGFATHESPFVRLFPNALISYGFCVFLLPLIYGAWKITAFQYAMGPILVSFLTNNPDEAPAIWCLFSFGIAAIIVYSPLRRWLRVERFFGWQMVGLRPVL